MSYQMGVVYIWNNQVGEHKHLSRKECMVTGPMVVYRGRKAWPTDAARFDTSADYVICAEIGDLRRKQPPSGELSILNMFVVAPPQRTKEIA